VINYINEYQLSHTLYW